MKEVQQPQKTLLTYPYKPDIQAPCLTIAFGVERLWDYEPSDLLGYRREHEEAEALRHHKAENDFYESFDEYDEGVPYRWETLLEQIVIFPVEVPV